MHLEFFYKGQRDYVHGTSIYKKIINLLEENGYTDITNLDFKFHNIIRNNLNFEIYSANNLKKEKSDCSMNFMFQNSKYYIFLNENKSPVKKRKEYLENKIVEKSNYDFHSKSASLIPFGKFNNIENIVALNKSLHEKLYETKNGKWFFTRLQIEKPLPVNCKKIEIKIVKDKSFRLTKSEIYIDKFVIGYIYFSLIQ